MVGALKKICDASQVRILQSYQNFTIIINICPCVCAVSAAVVRIP